MTRRKYISARVAFSAVVLFQFITPNQCVAAEDLGPLYPDRIDRCLKLPAAKGLEVDTETNPSYLRGDFDGDGKPDYAVSTVIKGEQRLRLLICTGNARAFLAGSDPKRPFSDMRDDHFFAPNWMVYSRGETLELRKFKTNVPYPLPPIKYETIAMIWEDGIALIYWDGRKFRWAGSNN